MADKTCPNCIYYNAPDTTCRRNSPAPSLSGTKVTWPAVTTTDWCADGYSLTDASYNNLPPGVLRPPP